MISHFSEYQVYKIKIFLIYPKVQDISKCENNSIKPQLYHQKKVVIKIQNYIKNHNYLKKNLPAYIKNSQMTFSNSKWKKSKTQTFIKKHQIYSMNIHVIKQPTTLNLNNNKFISSK